MRKPRYKIASIIYSSVISSTMGKGIGRGQRKCTFHLQAARNENRPYDEDHNKYLLALFLGKDIDGNDLVDDKFDKTKYSMDNELPSKELLQQVTVTVRNITRINNPGTPRCSIDECPNQAIKGGVCVTHGAKKRKKCSIDECPNLAIKGGVCVTHGAKKKKCSIDECPNQAQKGGVCVTHGAKKRKEQS